MSGIRCGRCERAFVYPKGDAYVFLAKHGWAEANGVVVCPRCVMNIAREGDHADDGKAGRNADESVGFNQIGGDRKVVDHDPVPSPPISSTPSKEVEKLTAAPHSKVRPYARTISFVREGDGDPRHGSPSTYSNHMCRCELCRAAQAAYMRDLRRRRKGQATS